MSGRCREGMERWLIWRVEGVWIFAVYRKQGGEVRVTNGLVRRARDTSSSERVRMRSEEHTSELQSLAYLVCRLLLEKKKNNKNSNRLSQHIRQCDRPV